MTKYKRILLKLSGEALASDSSFGIEPKILDDVVSIIKSVKDLGVEIAIVIGGGNLFRGAKLAKAGINRVTADHMGMLATVMNALAIQDVCKRNNIASEVMSGFDIGGGVCANFNHNLAKQNLTKGKVIIFSAGTGSPCFTTDTAAVLRAIEIKADIVFKATKVDGIYSEDPMKNPNAKKYNKLSFDKAIKKNLKIMDMAAFQLCREHKMPIYVFSMLGDGGILPRILQGEKLGSFVGE